MGDVGLKSLIIEGTKAKSGKSSNSTMEERIEVVKPVQRFHKFVSLILMESGV
jgi:hypothetical protein